MDTGLASGNFVVVGVWTYFGKFLQNFGSGPPESNSAFISDLEIVEAMSSPTFRWV